MLKLSMKLFTKFLLILFLPGLTYQLAGQTDTLSASEHSDSTKLKLYLDCHDCDFAYFRRKLPYVNFVRDPKLSDLHLLVTEQRTASDGRSYGLNFIGSGSFQHLNFKLITISPQSDSDLETWDRLLKTTCMGLMPFISGTTEKNAISITYNNESDESVLVKENYDKWNYWVFRVDLGADLDMEESQYEFSSEGSVRVDRITDKLKFRADLSYYRRIEKFQDDNEVIEGLREVTDSDIELVYSLNPKWSLGLFNEIRSSIYENTDFSNRIGPAIEYNIFPWDDSDRRIFSIGYHIQANYLNYRDITIYNYMEEFRGSESLRMAFILRQPWGELENELEGSHYFNDFSKNRLTLESRISINVTKGISIYTELDVGLIHDQLNLRADEISREELLLRQRELASTYEFSATMGINFTFGSIYNNIVNERF